MLLDMKRQPRNDWSDHFSADAADLIRIATVLAGFDLQAVLLRCFKRSRRAERISVPTVESVLQRISDQAKAVGA
jgi:hypothetical protein